MTAPESRHYPSIAGGIEEVTGSLEVDTGLREIQSLSASLNTAVAANEESHVTWAITDETGSTVKVTFSVTKGGTNHATAGDSAVNVSWIALGI